MQTTFVSRPLSSSINHSDQELRSLSYEDIVSKIFIDQHYPNENSRLAPILREKVRTLDDVDLVSQRFRAVSGPLGHLVIHAIDEEIHARIAHDKSWKDYRKLNKAQQEFVLCLANPGVYRDPRWQNEIKQKARHMSKEDLYYLRIANFWEPLNTEHTFAKKEIAKRHNELNNIDFQTIHNLNLTELQKDGWIYPNASFVRIYKSHVEKQLQMMDLSSLLNAVQNLSEAGKLARSRVQGVCLREIYFNRILMLLPNPFKTALFSEILFIKQLRPNVAKAQRTAFESKSNPERHRTLLNDLVHLEDSHIHPIFSRIPLAKL